MSDHLHYGAPAKVVYWLAVALLAIQFPIGWFRLPQLLSEVIDFKK